MSQSTLNTFLHNQSGFQLSEDATLTARFCKQGNGVWLPAFLLSSLGAQSLHTEALRTQAPHYTPSPHHPAPRSSPKNLSSSCSSSGEPGQPTAGTSKGIYKYSRRRKNRHFPSPSRACLSPTPDLSWSSSRSSSWAKAPKPRDPYWKSSAGKQLMVPWFP